MLNERHHETEQFESTMKRDTKDEVGYVEWSCCWETEGDGEKKITRDDDLLKDGL